MLWLHDLKFKITLYENFDTSDAEAVMQLCELVR
jgi:hypothetical protein